MYSSNHKFNLFAFRSFFVHASWNYVLAKLAHSRTIRLLESLLIVFISIAFLFEIFSSIIIEDISFLFHHLPNFSSFFGIVTSRFFPQNHQETSITSYSRLIQLTLVNITCRRKFRRSIYEMLFFEATTKLSTAQERYPVTQFWHLLFFISIILSSEFWKSLFIGSSVILLFGYIGINLITLLSAANFCKRINNTINKIAQIFFLVVFFTSSFYFIVFCFSILLLTSFHNGNIVQTVVPEFMDIRSFLLHDKL